MIKNKKGLSDIVVTLLIVLLGVVAVATIGIVVNNLMKSGGQSLELGALCNQLVLDATSVSCNTSGTACRVLVRKSGVTDPLGGVEINFLNATLAYSQTFDISGDISSVPTALKVDNSEWINANITNPNKLEIRPYFKDASNVKTYCQQVTEKFVAED